MGKLFSVSEANACLPALERAFERITSLRADLDGHLEELRVAGIPDVSLYLGGQRVAPESCAARIEMVRRLASVLEGELRTILETGAVVKDIDLGLVDFRGVVNGREVWLCWRVGETSVRFWHSLDTGFRSRRPLLRVVGERADAASGMLDDDSDGGPNIVPFIDPSTLN